MSQFITYRNNTWGTSFRINRRTASIVSGLLLLTLAVIVVSAGIGTLWIHPVDVVKVFLGFGSEQHVLIIQSFRLPRILTALLVGLCLASSGAILQSLVRNPLASPDMIGITGGASVAAVAFIVLFQTASIRFLPFAAFAGSTVTTFMIYFMAWKNGITPLRLVLTGVGAGAGLTALTTLLILKAPTQLTAKAVIWMTGSVYGSHWDAVSTLALWMLVLFPLAFGFGRSVNIQQLGDDVAISAGNPVEKHRFLLLVLCAALAGSAVAIGGAIGFIGLIAPHIGRKLVGNSFEDLFPVSALTGGLIVMLADLAGRTLFAPLDLPVGIFTAAIGAPFFLYLLYKNRNA